MEYVATTPHDWLLITLVQNKTEQDIYSDSTSITEMQVCTHNLLNSPFKCIWFFFSNDIYNTDRQEKRQKKRKEED